MGASRRYASCWTRTDPRPEHKGVSYLPCMHQDGVEVRGSAPRSVRRVFSEVFFTNAHCPKTTSSAVSTMDGR